MKPEDESDSEDSTSGPSPPKVQAAENEEAGPVDALEDQNLIEPAFQSPAGRVTPDPTLVPPFLEEVSRQLLEGGSGSGEVPLLPVDEEVDQRPLEERTAIVDLAAPDAPVDHPENTGPPSR
ncbi:hypothetical protein U1Q18_052557 [Sarracenia purpurea var. burkii]